MADLNSLKNILAANNYKLTSQRKQILKVLLDSQGEHLSAEDIYEILKEDNPGIGLATVYRTLELFCELGLVQELDFDEERKRYEVEGEGAHHHHLICLNCNKIIEFNDEILEDFEQNLQQEYNFEVTEHKMKFYGYCKDCKE
ncbi:Fur family transcriptional regulator [Halanaerobacter jeridensis]|uniref:Fur family ferric uptake transcriptional regulator n=1 Tax=Halanaerobacter jeridensis TaxID=706427 RepID=A0A938XP26_9FIRM|nr:Fur family transcriptional regulator [Halanaerobacter jeridensis]MBM7556137.1 Fur family ferric uptake transcriptional regulator [Halanaerobacter jeridensis]